MSAGAGGDQEFDLNLAPIIDCFTVLITYLLVSASFLSLNSLEVGVAVNGQAESTQPIDALPLSLVINIKTGHITEISVSGGKEKVAYTFEVAPRRNGTVDLALLKSKLNKVKSKWPALAEVTLKAEMGVPYKDVIKTVEGIKDIIPKVYLSN